MPDTVLGPRKTIANKTDNVFLVIKELIASVRRRTTKS